MSLGVAQAAVAALLAVGVVLVARWQALHLERETFVALARSLVQIVAVGSVLLLLLRGPDWTSVLVLATMMVVAAHMSAQRGRGLRGAFVVSLSGIGIGSGAVILLMTLVGVIDPALTSVVPVGSMLVYRAMITNGLVLDRLEAEVRAHAGWIEAGLALGARPGVVVGPYVRAAVRAGLIPGIEGLRSLGIVWIPGLMAGMILAGEDPIYAAVYQFVLMAMSYSVAGLTAVVSAYLVRGALFSPADQLLVRPGRTPGG
ncbi:MAG: ABC transporter permease [Chloroflexaceae bacterium]|nr:ABC transporter permease [Chloroflexaceae bacterium]